MLPINWLYSLNIDVGFPTSDCVNYIHENTFTALLLHLLLLPELSSDTSVLSPGHHVL